MAGWQACCVLALALGGCGGSGSSSPPDSGSISGPTGRTGATGGAGQQPALVGHVVASRLANPRQLSLGRDGTIYVAEAGNGGASHCLKPSGGGPPECIGETGSIGRVAGGRTTAVIGGLPSVATAGEQATGPAGVVATPSRLVFVIQNTATDKSAANRFGRLGRSLGHLASAKIDGTAVRLTADFAKYELIHNPDHGGGTPDSNVITTDPFGLAAYRGGYAVADAGANDLLWVDASGSVHTLAAFPAQTELDSSGHGPPARILAQAVPTSVAVGPDGALYVGELTGYPFQVGKARVWRVVPGSAPKLYLSGFTNISSIAFDGSGRLLVLEINHLGLSDPKGGGELIRVEPDGRRTVLISHGLTSPTGLAVAPDGSFYISNYGSSPSTGPAPHGEILHFTSG